MKESIDPLMMQGEERKKRKLTVNLKSPPDEYHLRERPREDEAKARNKVSISHINSKKRPWSWDRYLDEEGAVAAPVRVFTERQSIPSNRNGFKVGMRLEGVDPLHPSMFCVLSVAEVIGYRLRLHIDGYSDCYDFWVNADSPDIRPAGWCDTTEHKLHPPKGYKEDEFTWTAYQETCKGQTAPKNLFKTHNSAPGGPEVKMGMKLEAVDQKNPCLVCVATVADIVDGRFLVHFDNWDDTYDYWCDASSPYIHPVGWCQEHGRPLTAPQGHPNPENFVWEEYLADTRSSAVPSEVFCLRAPHRFQMNMKLETVDRRNPRLIRVATIVDAEDYRVKVHFDSWHEKFDFWVDSDLPDLHPAGWCARTGHPWSPHSGLQTSRLQPPRSVSNPRVQGVGHIKGARYTGHHSAFGCPYSDINMKKDVILPDRLGGEKQITFVPVRFVQKTKRLDPSEENQDEEADGGQVESRLAPSTRYLKIKEEEEEEEEIDLHAVFKAERDPDSMEQALHQSVFLSAMSPHPGRELPLCWEQHCKLLPGVVGVPASSVAQWTVEEVSEFIQSLPGCEEQAKQFKQEQIDGKAFLLLTQRDIVKIMGMKLGPALKIYNSILMFKHAEDTRPAGGDADIDT